MVADKFTDLQKAVGPEITKTDLVPAFQVKERTNLKKMKICNKNYQYKNILEPLIFFRVY